MKTFKWCSYCLIILLCIARVVTPAAANGAPVKIFLNYLPEFSNYGPTGASGVALVSLGEAWVELTIDGLPRLEDEIYEAWLIMADTEERVSLGTFNADADGHVAYFAELGELPIVNFEFFVITVEPDPDPSPEANARQTIAGVFPDPKLQIVTGTPTPTLAPGITPTPAPPIVLPVTGETIFDFSGLIWALSLGASLIVGGLGLKILNSGRGDQ